MDDTGAIPVGLSESITWVWWVEGALGQVSMPAVDRNDPQLTGVRLWQKRDDIATK